MGLEKNNTYCSSGPNVVKLVIVKVSRRIGTLAEQMLMEQM
jgi:hypothetical protein